MLSIQQIAKTEISDYIVFNTFTTHLAWPTSFLSSLVNYTKLTTHLKKENSELSQKVLAGAFHMSFGSFHWMSDLKSSGIIKQGGDQL